MHMSSGLSFTGQDDRWMDPAWQYHDHFFIYAGAVDAFRYSISSPVEFPPDTVGRYRNSDPMTLGFLVRQAVEKRQAMQWHMGCGGHSNLVAGRAKP